MTNTKKVERMLRHFEVEQLLFQEAQLLDSWQLMDWLDLFTEDANYLVPPMDVSEAELDPKKHLYYIADDKRRMTERVVRLDKKTCHSEFPRSKVRHLVSNVQVSDDDTSADICNVRASFVVYRSKDNTTHTFIGHYRYRLVLVDGSWKINTKECCLDMDGLKPHARISIIL